VIIGGTGFVGTWIAEMVAALNDSFEFGINLSLISRSTDQFSNRLPHLANRSDIILIKSDVRQLIQFPEDAEWVIHAAANPDVRTHASNPLDTASVIVDGTMSVMRAAERLGRLKKLLYLSSGLVCGTQLDSADGLTESAQGAPSPDSSFIYPNAKRFAETLCSSARAQSRIPVLVARPFSFIGPYQSLDTPWAQTSFLSDALRGNKIRVKGDGQIERSYLYGSDVAYWFLRILTVGQSGDVVNVGSSNAISLEDLAKEVARSFEPSPDIVFNTSPRSAGKPAKLLPDTSRAQNEYGLSVFTPLDQAVRLTAEWHRMMHDN
jgi:dTDP-glucose 4,6-dehydratase